MIYFTSDAHFGPSEIIFACKGPFTSAKHMEDKLINNWNNTVSGDDDIYALGDFALDDSLLPSEDYIKRLTSRLKGNLHLILRNHDTLDIDIYKNTLNLQIILKSSNVMPIPLS